MSESITDWWRRLLFALPLACASCAPAPPPPDVVLVIVDTLRADRTSAMPGGPDTTPHLAAWAKDGVVYSQAVAAASWTLPSMASMLAGKPVSRNRSAAFSDEPMLAERFAAAGYRTLGLVANPLLAQDNGFARGFDSYDVAPAFPRARQSPGEEAARPRARPGVAPSIHDLRAWDAEALVNRAIEEIAAVPDETPVFLYLHLMDPHVPYDSANEQLARPELGWSRDDGGGLVAWADGLDKQQTAVLIGWRRSYDGQVLFTDRALGRLFENLAQIRSRPALVAVTSDHGEGLFSHRRNPDSPPHDGPLGEGYRDHGEQVYEEAIRVPMWLVGPGVPAGRSEDRPVALYDLAHTLLSLAGLAEGGRSLPLDAGDPAPSEIFGCGTRGWFLRTAQRKLVVPSTMRAEKHGLRPRLFAVSGERLSAETEDLSTREAQPMHELMQHWERWVSELADQTETPVDPATLERMRALGYVR